MSEAVEQQAMNRDLVERAVTEASRFVRVSPLYTTYDFGALRQEAEVFEFLTRVQYPTDGFDHYCAGCRRERAFLPVSEFDPNPFGNAVSNFEKQRQQIRAIETRLKSMGRQQKDQAARNTQQIQLASAKARLADTVSGDYFVNLLFRCQVVPDHILFFSLHKSGSELRKIGQHPSTLDNQRPELDKYKPLLEAEKFAELNRAYGLNASGVAIGAYVYLRRLLEALVHDATVRALGEGDVDEDDLKRMRFSEKVGALAGYLPEALVEHPSVYGIMSKGIHELSEATCAELFPAMSLSVEMILDDMLAAKIVAESRAEKSAIIAEAARRLDSGSS